MLLKFILICSLSLTICVKANPSRLKILPGLAFYRTDDDHDDSDAMLNDQDKNLYNPLWQVANKMNDKYPVGTKHSDAHRNMAERGGMPERGNMPERLGLPGGLIRPRPGDMHPGKDKSPPHGPSLGTPITTINVYSAYPGRDTPFTATTYHHPPQFHRNGPGATPFSSNAITSSDMRNPPGQNPPEQLLKNLPPNPFESFMNPSNSAPNLFDQSDNSPGPMRTQDGMLPQNQFDAMMNSGGNLDQPFGGQFDPNSDGFPRHPFDQIGKGMGLGYNNPMGMDSTQSGSAPLQFLMPQIPKNNPPQMQSFEEMMQNTFQNMNADHMRPRLLY